jgi:type I restriction enzyme, S subunit
MSFPRYPKYKDSGVEWLGEVPEHWEVRRLRQIGPLLKGSGGSKEDIVESGVPCIRYGDLYTTHAYFILQARTHVSEERAADYFPIQKGDVLFAASGEDLAEIGRSAVTLIDERVCCGGDLVILRPQMTVVPEFMGYACDCWVSKAQKASMGRGTTVKHIYPDELKRLLLALPPAPEQTAIATFLDHETAKIDALIAEQQRLIEVLQEKRQAVISHAVTKGLNPDAPMKDSGIEWLGEVPEHWKVGPLKRFWATTDCKHITAEFVDEGYPLASIREVQSRWVDLSTAKQTTEHFYLQLIEGGRKPMEGDLIFSRNATVGEVAQVPANPPAFAMGQDVCLLRRHRSGYSAAYLHAVLRSPVVVEQITQLMIGSTFKRINVEEIRGLMIPMPPSAEQSDIAGRIASVAGEIDCLAVEAVRTVALLQERRSALISAAVTGQIDVRGLTGSEAA